MSEQKRICFACGNSGYIRMGQFQGLPCPAGCLKKKKEGSK